MNYNNNLGYFENLNYENNLSATFSNININKNIEKILRCKK